MLFEAKNFAVRAFKLFQLNAKQLPPAAAKLILYGARDMSKKKFYVDGIQRYAAYMRKCFFAENLLFKFTVRKQYTSPTYLIGTSRRCLRTLQLEKQMNVCFVSISLYNLPYLLKKRIPFVALSPLKAYLDKVFMQQMDSVCPSLNDEFGIEKYVARNNFTCFVYDSPTTINNLLAYYFRKQGKKVIYLQHGIYQLSNYKLDETTKNFATGFVVWGEAFRQLFIDNGVDKSKIRIACINKPVKRLVEQVKTNDICFFGLPLTKFNNDTVAEMLNAVKEANNAAERLGYRLVYKPHPMENVSDTEARFKDNAIQVPILPLKQSIQKVLSTYNCFIGLYSTSLIEAGMLNKKVLQIILKNKQYDDFSRLGICRSVRISENMIAALRETVNEVSSQLTPDSYYIRYTENPGLRYKQCIDSLLSETIILNTNERLYA